MTDLALDGEGRKKLVAKATEWLSVGGFWNPEMMSTRQMADLIMELRDALKAVCDASQLAGLDGEGRLQERIDRFLASKACSRNPGCPWDDRADRLCYQCEARELITLLSALSVPAAPPRSEQFQRVLQEMEGAAGQYGLGETLAVALHSWVRQLESLTVAPPPQEGFCDCRLLPPTVCALCHRPKQPTVAPPPQEQS
jgi:hypothetical protein